MKTSVAVLSIQHDKRDISCEITKDLIEIASAEDRCISISLHENLENSNLITLIEHWDTEDGAVQLKNEKRLRELVTLLKEQCTKEPVLMNKYSGVFTIL